MNSGRCLRHREILVRSTLRATILAALMMFMVVAMVSAQTSTAAFQDDMRKLWEDHITWTRLYIVAATRWQANADEIANFLHGANPDNWPVEDAKSMLREHLDLTTAEVVAHLGQDWAADVAAYDRVHEQILHMADMLSAGIVAQFPDRFVAG